MTISNEIPVYPRRFPDWQKEFEAVLAEGDSDKLPRLLAGVTGAGRNLHM